MRYTHKQFKAQYATDDICLEAVFQDRFGDMKHCPKCAAETKFYRVKKRQCYACKWCGHQLFPLADTIFRSSTTPLTDWFYAIYLFSVAKNGISAAELQRHLGVTYKTAWRMGKQIRKLMEQDDDKLSGIIEADEAVIGGKSNKHWRKNKQKTEVVAMVERKGKMKATVANADATTVIPLLRANVTEDSVVNTDGSKIYSRVKRYFDHEWVNHSKKEFARGGAHINTIEGFFGYFQTALLGTYQGVSPKYLQSYLNQYVYLYNHRDVAVGPVLLERALKPVG